MKFPLSAALLLVFAATFWAAENPNSPAASGSSRASGPPAAPLGPAPSIPRAAAQGEAAPALDPAKAIKRLDGNRYDLNGITFDKKTRAITLAAKVNMTDGLLEYALVHESGKVHESLLSTAISPFDLNVVLLLLNYEAGSGFFDLSDKAAGAVPVKNPDIPASARVNVSLDWKEPDGTAKSARLETLLLNLDQKGPVSDGPFAYTGSMLMDDGTFLAKDTGSILALYVDVAALINNPREGNGNDDIWVPDKTKVPARDTPVTVTFSPVSAKSGMEKAAGREKGKAEPKKAPAASRPQAPRPSGPSMKK